MNNDTKKIKHIKNFYEYILTFSVEIDLLEIAKDCW